MAAKDTSVDGLTKGVEFLFKKNNVEYIKGTASFSGEHEVTVNRLDGSGEQSLRAKNIIIATGSEATPFPGLTIDEKKVVTSTGAISLQEVPKKMVVIGGGIIGLEMVSILLIISSLHMKRCCDNHSILVGLCLDTLGCRGHSRRVLRSNRRSWHGCRNLQSSTEDLGQTGHEVQA